MDKIKQTDRHTHKHAHMHLYTYTKTRKHAHIVSPISSLYYIIPYSIHTLKHTPIPTHTHTPHSHRQTCASIITKSYMHTSHNNGIRKQTSKYAYSRCRICGSSLVYFY